MFLGTYEYSWISVNDLDILSEELRDAGPSKKKKGLSEAFEHAKEGFNLDDVKEFQEASPMDIDMEEEEEEEEEDEEEEVEEPESDDAKPKKQGKKRKKPASEDDETPEKPSKTPKKAAAAKAKTPKATPKAAKPAANGTKSASKAKATPAKEKKAPKSEKKATPAAGRKKAPTKSKDTVVESESEEERSEELEKVETDPAKMSLEDQKKYVYVRRHTLQKAFLNKDNKLPDDADMESMSDHLTKLEEYPGLQASLILETKIHKVLKGIVKLASIPLDAQYKFKERCTKLLDKWNSTLNGAEKKGSPKKENGVTEKKETNGHKESTPSEKADAKAEEASKKDEDTEMADGPAAEDKAEKEIKDTADKENEKAAEPVSEVTAA